jgi:hypothetical protein
MHITSNVYESQNVYCIQPFYYAESARKNIPSVREMTPTERAVEQFYWKTNDKYVANIGGLYKFYYMSSSNSMIVYCEARYLNTSRNLNQT